MEQVQDSKTKLWRFQYPKKARGRTRRAILRASWHKWKNRMSSFKATNIPSNIYSCPDNTLKSRRMVEETRAKQLYELNYRKLTDAH